MNLPGTGTLYLIIRKRIAIPMCRGGEDGSRTTFDEMPSMRPLDLKSASDPPAYFLVEASRSGSTLLRVMMDCHPDISIIRHSAIEMGLQYMNDDGVAATNLQPYYWELGGSYGIRESGVIIDRSMTLHDCLRDQLAQLARSSSKPILGGSLHHNFPRLLFVFPNARFIYLYRDGRDVARSGMALGWYDNYWTAVEAWMTAELQAKQMRSRLPAERWIEICYEDLILHPREILGRICEFMGTSYDEAIFDYTNVTRYKEPDPTLVEQWRGKMSSAEIQVAEARIGQLLEDRGYPLSGLPRIDVSPAAARRYSTKGVWKARVRRARRIGLFNFITEVLTRKLGMDGLHSRIAFRIDTQRQKMLR